MKILLTGHKGFIGKNFVEHFADHELSYYEWGDSLPNLIGLDWVIHLGAITSTTEKDVHKLLEQNYYFSNWLFEQCGQHNVNLQYASSASIYGNSSSFKETDMPSPMNAYAWTKLLFEDYVAKNLYKYPGMIAQGFRYFNVYGPHEDHKDEQASPFHKFRQQAKTTGIIKLFHGSSKFLRDFVHVDTLANVQKKFLSIPTSGIWNIGTGKPISFLTVAEQISQETNANIHFITMPNNLKNQYQTFTCADLTKLQATLDEKSSC